MRSICHGFLPISTTSLWATGMGPSRSGTKAWYAGTPEFDRFPRGAGHEPGNVLIVAAERGAPPQVTSVGVARLGWHQLAYRVY